VLLGVFPELHFGLSGRSSTAVTNRFGKVHARILLAGEVRPVAQTPTTRLGDTRFSGGGWNFRKLEDLVIELKNFSKRINNRLSWPSVSREGAVHFL